MSDGMIVALAFVCIGLLVVVVGFIGNKIVDKGSDAIRNKAVRKKNLGNPSEPESLADRWQCLWLCRSRHAARK